VHFFQKSFSDEMGIAATGIFGPAPPEPRQILTLTKTGAELIIDNAHNPVGGTMKEILKDAGYVLLLNFPGMYETKTLTDVIEYNLEQLMGALQELNR
jgi:zinc transport system substrate-binding protein